MTFNRIKTITSHVGHARYNMELNEDILGYIPTPRGIPSPYSHSPSTPVWQHESGKRVFIKETSHKRYEVFEVPASLTLLTDDEAIQHYIDAR